MPPRAPAAGSASVGRLDSWPSATSRLISRPTSRKNTAIRPSLIQSSSGLASASAPIRTSTGVSHRAPYQARNGELASSIASTPAPTRTIPPAASSARNSRSASRAERGVSCSRSVGVIPRRLHAEPAALALQRGFAADGRARLPVVLRDLLLGSTALANGSAEARLGALALLPGVLCLPCIATAEADPACVGTAAQEAASNGSRHLPLPLPSFFL